MQDAVPRELHARIKQEQAGRANESSKGSWSDPEQSPVLSTQNQASSSSPGPHLPLPLALQLLQLLRRRSLQRRGTAQNMQCSREEVMHMETGAML